MATITELPEYQQARDEYTGAVTAAKAAGDALAEANAELAWERRQNALRDTLAERQGAQAALEAALAEVKEKYPTVPEAMYARLSDPEQIRQVAEESHKAIETAAKQRTPTQRTAQWAAPAAGQATPQSREKDKWEDPEFIRENSDRIIRKKDPRAIEELQEVIFDRQILPRFSKYHQQTEEARERTTQR